MPQLAAPVLQASLPDPRLPTQASRQQYGLPHPLLPTQNNACASCHFSALTVQFGLLDCKELWPDARQHPQHAHAASKCHRWAGLSCRFTPASRSHSCWWPRWVHERPQAMVACLQQAFDLYRLTTWASPLRLEHLMRLGLGGDMLVNMLLSRWCHGSETLQWHPVLSQNNDLDLLLLAEPAQHCHHRLGFAAALSIATKHA